MSDSKKDELQVGDVVEVQVVETKDPPVMVRGEDGITRMALPFQGIASWWMLVGVMAFLFVLSPTAASAAPFAANGLVVDADTITAGFFDGANLVLGMAGLIALMALPYGIQFAFNLISGIFGKFSTTRFGG